MTTVSDDAGRRAGYVRYVLDLMGCSDIPSAAGADVASGSYRYALDYPPEIENWPEHITPRPGSPDKAVSSSNRVSSKGRSLSGLARGPTSCCWNTPILAYSSKPPCFSWAALCLTSRLYTRGGVLRMITRQVDISSARFVLERANPTLVPITVSCQTALRRAYLPRLARTGRLGELIVRQAAVCARSEQKEQCYGESCSELPRDIINFQHDPLACAIALGWHKGVKIETVPLTQETRDGWLYRDSREFRHTHTPGHANRWKRL